MATMTEPPDRYGLNLLLQPNIDPKTGKSRVGFEKVEQCVIGDRHRGLSLRNIVVAPERSRPVHVQQIAEPQPLDLDPGSHELG